MEMRTLSQLLLTALTAFAVKAQAGGFLSTVCDRFLESRLPLVQAGDVNAHALVRDLNSYWAEVFARRGWPFRKLQYREYHDKLLTDCGTLVTRQGPIYCQADSTLYVDRAWFREYRHSIITASETFLKYVLAHEMAHHLQNQMADFVLGQVAAASGGPNLRGDYLKNMELQADCLAGLYLDRAGHLRTSELMTESLLGVGLMGDDFVQASGGYPHGTGAERLTWFTKGMHAEGDIAACEPFSFLVFKKRPMIDRPDF